MTSLPALSTRPALPLAAAALSLALGAGAALAQPVGDPGGSGRLTPAQWQKIFPEFRQQALQDHRARAAILQRGERCIAAAGNGDALRACMREERNAMQQQRQEHRTAMRSLFERNGIPTPEWKNRRGGPGGGPGWRGGEG
ncbi:MAG: hypothetical protein ACKOZW_14845 [Cyanobium sp.]